MAWGFPVIAADGGATPEVVEHEVTGLLYRGGDPGALAAAVRRLRDDDALRARLVRQAHEQAHRRWTAAVHRADMSAMWQRVTST
jgi:glycosyltransferase involved in cell wall biosynthesis